MLPHSALQQEAIPLPQKPNLAAVKKDKDQMLCSTNSFQVFVEDQMSLKQEEMQSNEIDIDQTECVEDSLAYPSTLLPESAGTGYHQETPEGRIAAWLTLEAYNKM